MVASLTLSLSDQSHLAKEKAKTDAQYYKSMKEAEANKVGDCALWANNVDAVACSVSL